MSPLKLETTTDDDLTASRLIRAQGPLGGRQNLVRITGDMPGVRPSSQGTEGRSALSSVLGYFRPSPAQFFVRASVQQAPRILTVAARCSGKHSGRRPCRLGNSPILQDGGFQQSSSTISDDLLLCRMIPNTAPRTLRLMDASAIRAHEL